MHIQDLITENVNTIEVYFCPEKLNSSGNIFACGWNQLPRLPTKAFKNRMDQVMVEYSHRDISYLYDMSNDSQKVIQRNCILDTAAEHIYTLALCEETLPAHRFPCTMDINEKKKYHKVSYKYNNRIFFHVEKDETDIYTLFLRYQHAYNVDLEKMNEDWKMVYQQLTRSIYG